MAERRYWTRGTVGDIGLVLAVYFAMAVATSFSAGANRPDLVGWLLLMLMAALLVFRRRAPVVVMWSVIAVALAYDLLGYPSAFYTVAIGVGIYSAAAHGRRWMAAAAVVLSLVAFFVVDYLFATGHVIDGPGALWFLGWLTVFFLVGEVGRSRREYVQSVEQRAIEAERTREEEARRRAGEERMRIARELHDVLAHSISIINVQAGAASHHLDHDVEKTRAALTVVRETGKEALRELRSSLGVLRGEEGANVERAPSPSLSDLDRLVNATREAGQPVEIRRRGDLGDIDPDIGLTVYRIVQEGLTNVTRHGGEANATVTIADEGSRVVVTIEDDGAGTMGPPSEGLGLAGMRERVAAHGGDLDTGPRPNGGFRVRATIPLPVRA